MLRAQQHIRQREETGEVDMQELQELSDSMLRSLVVVQESAQVQVVQAVLRVVERLVAGCDVGEGQALLPAELALLQGLADAGVAGALADFLLAAGECCCC